MHRTAIRASPLQQRPAPLPIRRLPRPLALIKPCAMSGSAEAALLQLSQQVLDAIAAGDYAAYASFCHPSMSCFEPEAKGHLIEG